MECEDASRQRVDLLQGLTTLFFALTQPEASDAVGQARETVGTLASLLLGRFDGDAALAGSLQACLDGIAASGFAAPGAGDKMHPAALHFAVLMASTVSRAGGPRQWAPRVPPVPWQCWCLSLGGGWALGTVCGWVGCVCSVWRLDGRQGFLFLVIISKPGRVSFLKFELGSGS